MLKISRFSSENIKAVAKSLFVIFSLVLSWIPTRAELKTRNSERRLFFRIIRNYFPLKFLGTEKENQFLQLVLLVALFFKNT